MSVFCELMISENKVLLVHQLSSNLTFISSSFSFFFVFFFVFLFFFFSFFFSSSSPSFLSSSSSSFFFLHFFVFFLILFLLHLLIHSPARSLGVTVFMCMLPLSQCTCSKAPEILRQEVTPYHLTGVHYEQD